MTFGDWLSKTADRYRERGPVEATSESARQLYVGALRRVGRCWNYGTPVWEREWDVLVILDACRYDLFADVRSEYGWIPNDGEAMYSAASHSREWLRRHTDDQYSENLARTALITANTFTSEIDVSGFGHVKEVWTWGWDDEAGTTLPRSVTDAAIAHARSDPDTDRLIVWYMQPHIPFVGAEWSVGYPGPAPESVIEEGDPWNQYRRGAITRKMLWNAYADNLRLALNDVELLSENIDAERFVITADHGNAMGEWGIYGHPFDVPVPAIKRVPWVEMKTRDNKEYQPTLTESQGELSNEEVRERLAALGYT